MGAGAWSSEVARERTRIRERVPVKQVFTQTSGCHALMNPHGMKFRESCDSAAHPRSRAIAWFVDVTNSMRQIPHMLAKETLPHFGDLVSSIIPDMQVLFGAIGDAVDGDRAPWQIGQFESDDRLIDEWLTRLYLEGQGGPYGHESYELAFYFAARLARIDCFEKRREKGYLFVTGDELPYGHVHAMVVNRYLGREELPSDLQTKQIIEEATEKFHCFFLIPDLRRAEYCQREWHDLLGDRAIVLEDPSDTSYVAASLIGLTEEFYTDLEHVMSVLEARGCDQGRCHRIYRTLRPYAALIGAAGTMRKVGLTHAFTERASGNIRL